MKTFVVFSFLMAFVMATVSQKDEHEPIPGQEETDKDIEGNDQPMAAEVRDFGAGKQAEDTPSFKNADFGGSFHQVFVSGYNYIMFPFSGQSHNLFLPVTNYQSKNQLYVRTVVFVLLFSRSVWTVCD